VAGSDPAPVEAASTRLINALVAGQKAGLFDFLGGSGYAVAVQAGGDTLVRSGSTAQMWAWMDGFRRGQELVAPGGWWKSGGIEKAVPRMEQARDSVAAYRRLLVDTSLVDQLRIQILAAMEALGYTAKDVALNMGKSPQAVREALSFDNPNPVIGNLGLFDAMIRACGRRFVVGTDLLGGEQYLKPAPGPAGAGLPEGVLRMLALLIAVDLHLVDRVDPVAPNKARRAFRFQVSVGGEEVVRPKETLVPWLQGLADGAGVVKAQTALTFR
jgi:hypothetical protein